MSTLSFEKINNFLVIGPIYSNFENFSKIKNLSKNYDLTVINGSLFYPFNKNNISKIINELISLENYNCFYNVSDLDYKSGLECPILFSFLNKKNNITKVTMERKNDVIITSGGFSLEMSMNSFTNNNLESSFISYINEKSWHKGYNGKLGYVISNNPLSDNKPEFFNYSCRIGAKYNENYKIYAQEVCFSGIKKTFEL